MWRCTADGEVSETLMKGGADGKCGLSEELPARGHNIHGTDVELAARCTHNRPASLKTQRWLLIGRPRPLPRLNRVCWASLDQLLPV